MKSSQQSAFSIQPLTFLAIMTADCWALIAAVG
jgi:hypothetical protein